ncbi:MAG: hypothetical protein AB1324_05985 [Candidatus Micrarchaeota archaeon]
MAELALRRTDFTAPAPPLFARRTLQGEVSDAVSSLIVRGSITMDAGERASAANQLALLGCSVSARLAFKSGLRKAAIESIDTSALAAELARASRGPVADALFSASMDCLSSGGYCETRAAGAMASALARNVTDSAVPGAVESALRLLKSRDKSVREAGSRVLISLCRHPSTDPREIAELAYDTGTKEGCFAAETALRMPPKIIDVPG